jgi:hypothetical protein
MLISTINKQWYYRERQKHMRHNSDPRTPSGTPGSDNFDRLPPSHWCWSLHAFPVMLSLQLASWQQCQHISNKEVNWIQLNSTEWLLIYLIFWRPDYLGTLNLSFFFNMLLAEFFIIFKLRTIFFTRNVTMCMTCLHAMFHESPTLNWQLKTFWPCRHLVILSSNKPLP